MKEETGESKNYIGLTSTTFKERFGNRKSNCNNEKYAHATTLSSYVWNLKRENKNPKIKFSILKQVKSFTPEIGKCHLCIAEKNGNL